MPDLIDSIGGQQWTMRSTMTGLAAGFPLALFSAAPFSGFAGQPIGRWRFGGSGGILPVERQLPFQFGDLFFPVSDLLFGVADTLLGVSDPLFGISVPLLFLGELFGLLAELLPQQLHLVAQSLVLATQPVSIRSRMSFGSRSSMLWSHHL